MSHIGKKNFRSLVLCGTLTVILSPAVFAEDVSPGVPKTEPVGATEAPAEVPPEQNMVEAEKPRAAFPQKEKAAAAPKTNSTPAAKSKTAATQSSFVNSFLNPPASVTPVPQSKAKAVQATRASQARGVAPVYNYGTTQRSFGTYNYAGGNNNRFNNGFANNRGFQAGNNARGTVSPVFGVGPQMTINPKYQGLVKSDDQKRQEMEAIGRGRWR